MDSGLSVGRERGCQHAAVEKDEVSTRMEFSGFVVGNGLRQLTPVSLLTPLDFARKIEVVAKALNRLSSPFKLETHSSFPLGENGGRSGRSRYLSP